MHEPRTLLSVEEAAKVIGVSRTTMFEIIRDGEIETVKIGRLRRVAIDAIDAYIEAQTERGATDIPDRPERQPKPSTKPTPQNPVFLAAHSAGEPEQNDKATDAKPPSATELAKPKRGPQRPRGTRAPNGASSIYFSEADGYWHGWVLVGTRDDGKPDRRHRKAREEKDIIKKVRKLEQERDTGQLRDVGPTWTVGQWLTYWVENIAAPTVRDTSADAYRNAVNNHLVPGIGAHRLDKIKPEHFERLYQRMLKEGHASGNAHQVHRTARRAFGVALKRGYIMRNVVQLADPPRLEEVEIEPYEVEEAQKILACADGRRNAARWAVALVLGLRQGEALGLKWTDIDLEDLTLRVLRNRLRPKYVHGCGGDPCGRKAGYCPQKVNKRKECGEVKSRAGKRPMGIPEPLGVLLIAQKAAQDTEREAAGDLWQDKGYVFATETGEPLNPNTDFHEWKDLLKASGVREGRLHDARHTAATILLGLHITDRATQAIMGWSDASMAKRYQHLVKRIRDDVAKRQGNLIWTPDEAEEDDPEPPTATQTATPEPED